MATGLDMSLDDVIAKNRKSRGSGSGPGPTRRNNPNRKSNRSSPYQSAKAPESTWEHEAFRSRSTRSSAGIETGTKLYISNLDYGVMNDDIKELFSEVGELKRYTVHFDRSGRSKGTAEVVYSRRGDAIAAVKKYNDVQLDGKPMKIEIVGTNLQTQSLLDQGIQTFIVVQGAEEDKGEVVNNNVVVVEEEAVVEVVAGVLARAQQRRYLLKILMRILISTTQQIWRQ
ncbi:unnamed protein product, partial [Brassica oleracea var. botrytis]